MILSFGKTCQAFSLSILLLLGLTGTASAKETLEIGVLVDRDKVHVGERWAGVENFLNAESDAFTFRVNPLTFDELETAVSNRELSYVLANPSFYIYLQELYGLSSPLLTLINRADDALIQAFGGVIFTRADNNRIQSLADLSNSRVGIVDRRSFGGYQVQFTELEHQQPDLGARLNIRELGVPQDRVVEAVLAGDVDAGFVRTGIIEALISEGRLQEQAIRILNPQRLPAYPLKSSTPLYPEWPMASLPHTNQQATKILLSRLLQISSNDSILTELQIGGFTVPASYISVENLMREQRIDPFNEIGTIRLSDLWDRYSLSITLAVLLLTFMIFAMVLSLNLNRQLSAARKQMEEDKNQLEEIIWATRVGTWSWNTRTLYLTYNDYWAEMLGYTREELGNIKVPQVMEMIHPEDLPRVEETLARHFAGEISHFNIELRTRHKDGHWVWIQSLGTIVERDRSGEPLRLSGTHHDISLRKELETERANYQKQLEEMATKDSLTSLFNRRYFMDSASKLFEIAVRYQQPLSYLMIDADEFKAINDRYGHDAGDQVLLKIAELLKQNIRQADLLARLGGEEFGILMPNTDSVQAMAIAQRITEVSKEQSVTNGTHQIKFSLSIGVSELSSHTQSLNNLMVCADKALYAVKHSGKGHARLYRLASL